PPPAVMERMRGLGLDETQVVFPGLVKDIRPVLGACDVGFVLSYREAASYALYEAMSMGLPALVSDAGGLPEGVQAGMGWIVPTGDVAALAQKLQVILAKDAATLAHMGQSARTRIKSAFTVPVFLERTQAVYHEA